MSLDILSPLLVAPPFRFVGAGVPVYGPVYSTHGRVRLDGSMVGRVVLDGSTVGRVIGQAGAVGSQADGGR